MEYKFTEHKFMEMYRKYLPKSYPMHSFPVLRVSRGRAVSTRCQLSYLVPFVSRKRHY